MTDVRQALRNYADKLAKSREHQRGEPDMRQHGDMMLMECLEFENEIADEIERLRADRDRLAAELADAERYRWLRSFAGRTSELPDFDEPKSPEHMDAMIDAARTAPSAGAGHG